MRRLSLFLLVLSSLLAACGGLSDATPTSPAQGAVRIVPTGTVAPTQDASAVFDIPADDPRAIGNPLAVVTIVDYSDFE